MKKNTIRMLVAGYLLLSVFSLKGFAQTFFTNNEEFSGPYASWINIKTKYGAKGDGTTDDTPAFQKALDELFVNEKELDNRILYIPAGTYRITKGLTMKKRIKIGIIGEDPLTTIIKWDGPVDGTMLLLNGVSYARYGRITWDGNGKAKMAIAHMWDGAQNYYPTHNQHFDEFFKNVGIGIRGGQPNFGDAEYAVLRCRFYNNTIAGVSIQSFNALDYFIWDSYFENCYVGVTNDPKGMGGGGNFHIYRSVFHGSTYADISIKNTMYFSFRGNYSIGSKAFFVAEGVGQNGGPITIQKNTIIDPIDANCIRINNKGPVTFLDNVIRSKAGAVAPVVYNDGDITSIGNTFTLANPISVKAGEKFIKYGDKIVSAGSINATEPPLPNVPVKVTRKVFEIPGGVWDDAIQKAVDSCMLKYKGQHPVIHLQPGTHPLTKTVTIPAGADLQLIGDNDQGTNNLSAADATVSPVLHIIDPQNVYLSNFGIVGALSKADGLLIDHQDQPGQVIYIEQADLGYPAVGLWANGLNNANVELHNVNLGGNSVGLKSTGGTKGAGNLNGRINSFGGSSSGLPGYAYAVENNGRLMSQDIWYEGSPSKFLTLQGSGVFTLNGAKIAPNPEDTSVQINNLSGMATFLGVDINGKFVVRGNGSNCNVLAMGMQYKGAAIAYTNSSPNAKAASINCRTYNNGSQPLANVGTADSAYIVKMLAQVRTELPTYFPATGLKINRINVFQTKNYDIQIRPSGSLTGIIVTHPGEDFHAIIHPNPTRENSMLSYQLAENSLVKISVYDLLGKEIMQVANEKQNAGEYKLTLNTEQLQSGIYFVKMNVNGGQTSKKLILNK